jgi:anthranilate phosphoribosyltransferase
MRHVAPVRKDLGIRTIFNILGPLVNPAQAKYQLVGVYHKGLLAPMAEVLRRLGSKRAWVVHGEDGLDELTTTSTTHVAELIDGEIRTFEIKPESLGLARVTLEALEGGSVEHNAVELNKLLAGSGSDAYRDIAALNAGASLYIAGQVTSLQHGVDKALEMLKTDKPQQILRDLVRISNE